MNSFCEKIPSTATFDPLFLEKRVNSVYELGCIISHSFLHTQEKKQSNSKSIKKTKLFNKQNKHLSLSNTTVNLKLHDHHKINVSMQNSTQVITIHSLKDCALQCLMTGNYILLPETCQPSLINEKRSKKMYVTLIM